MQSLKVDFSNIVKIKKLILTFSILLLSFPLFSQGNRHAFEVNNKLGRGVNIGNTFEAPSETAWGNSWDQSYVKIIADLGFSHIRLPVRWEVPERSMETAPYTISATFLERIKGVVDEAIRNDLHIIINMHHHEALYANPAGQKARFLSQWQQIADYFKAYPDNLLFEILNEPHEVLLDANLWNEFAADALKEIRKTNPERCVLICSSNWGGINGLNLLKIPDDENLILTVHYYNPFDFTHQGADWANMQDVTGIKWLDTELDREVVRKEFKEVRLFAEKHNIPVHVGEFGAYSAADLDSRARWTTFVARFFEEQGYSWAYWEFNAGFGFFNPGTKTFVQPLVDALLHNSLPDPTPFTTALVYRSNFIYEGLSGWYFQKSNGAEASTAISGDVLDINITDNGTESWHVQLTRPNVCIEIGELYQLSFKASATKECSITSYVGRNESPWDAYSNYQTCFFTDEEESFSYTFTMKSLTDTYSRICFDLGSATAGTTISFRDIMLEKLQIGDVSNRPKPEVPLLKIWSEDSGIINILGELINSAEVYDMQGRLIKKVFTNSGNVVINDMPNGLLIVKVKTNNGYFSRKVIVK